MYKQKFFRDAHTSSTKYFLNDNSFSESGNFPIGADLQLLHEDRLKFVRNPLIGYLNINSLRNKIADLRIFLKNLPLEYLVLGETKLDESLPNAQFSSLDDYEIRTRTDRNKNGGGLIEFVCRGFICKRMKEFEPKK